MGFVSGTTKDGKKFTDYKEFKKHSDELKKAEKEKKSSNTSKSTSASTSNSSSAKKLTYKEAVDSLRDSKGNLPSGWGYAVDKMMSDSSYKTPDTSNGNVTFNSSSGKYTVTNDKGYNIYDANGNFIAGGLKGTENWTADRPEGTYSLSDGGSLYGSGSNLGYASSLPQYNGFDAEELTKAWLDKMKSGIEGAANSQLDTIKQNLAEVLSALEGEKGTVQGQNEKLLETIHNNEFATTELQKELMNQSGWNPNNSGLAVGEIGKIKIGADKNRADANAALVEALNDIARRSTLANTRAANDRASVEKWKDTQLSGAEAQALLYGDEIGYQRYRDSMSDYVNNRNFNYQQYLDDRNFDYQKYINDRNYDYQVSRGQVLDEQWLKQFSAQEQQRIIDNAIKERQISVDEGRLALQKAAQSWSQSHSGSSGSGSGSSGEPTETIGPLYNSMMSSADPAKWLTDNSMYLTKDELKTLYGMLPKTSSNKTIDDWLDQLNLND